MSVAKLANATGRRQSQRRLSSVSRWLERPQRSCWRQNVRQSDGASVSTNAVDWYTVRQPARSSSSVSTRSSPTCCGTPSTVCRDEPLDRRRERGAAVGDRPPGEAPDLAEDRLRGDRQVVADVLHPVREPRTGWSRASKIAWRGVTPPTRGSAKGRSSSRSASGAQSVSESSTITTSVAGSLAAQPGCDRGALARLGDAQHVVAVCGGDRGDVRVAAVDDRDQLDRAGSRRRCPARGGTAARAR